MLMNKLEVQLCNMVSTIYFFAATLGPGPWGPPLYIYLMAQALLPPAPNKFLEAERFPRGCFWALGLNFAAFGELLEGFWEALVIIWESLGGLCLFFVGLLPENGSMTTFLIILVGLGLIFGAFGDPLEGFWELLGVIWTSSDGPWPFLGGFCRKT